MSRMSMLHAELMEQASELGFQDLGEAEQAGYGVDWQNARLIKVEDEQDKAHEAWLEERDTLLKNLEEQEKFARESYEVDHTVIRHAIDFIRKGEC